MKGLRTVIYKVEDLQKAVEWYSKAFNTKPYFEEPFYVGFNIGGFELGLMPDSNTKGTNIEAYWAVDDIHDAYERLLTIGAQKVAEPTNVGGDLMVATVLDPWKNIIGIIYNPHFKFNEDN